ncbi:MAG: tRNA pseudouridine(55) synthase TruB [bacterium]
MDKPAGRTSHDVVARVRRVLSGAKVGHAGTLDPDATGVLVLCVGNATKISAFLMEGEKEYRGVGRLGVVTDTQDASGQVLAERKVDVTLENLREAAREFLGRIEQIPPMFSAVKIDGQKLYRLARKGVEVERPARTVHVRSFEITSIDGADFEFVVTCSKGTYVRTLVHDLGARLGCGGHLARLVRSRQGGFSLENAVPWAALEEADAAAAIGRAKVDPDQALEFLPECDLSTGPDPVRAGALLPRDRAPEDVEGVVRVRLPGGRHGGIARIDDEGVRVLHLFPPGSTWGRGRRTS